jgi:hypothetical protein
VRASQQLTSDSHERKRREKREGENRREKYREKES